MAAASAFAAAWIKASPALDKAFGQAFVYQPMVPNPAGGRPMADPARAATAITGVLTERPVFVYPETRSRRGSIVSQEATQDSSIDIATTALPYEPKSGDRLIAVDPATGQATGAVYEVNGPQPDGIARNQLRVVTLASAA